MKELYLQIADRIIVECAAQGYYPDDQELHAMVMVELKGRNLA